MRLFVAVMPPAAALDEIDAAVAPYRREDTALRWVAPERWHVTLSFLGDVGDEGQRRLYPKLQRAAARHGPLELSFAGAGAFPRTGRGRVLWAGMGGETAELGELASSVAGAARESGIEQEARKFSAHLTLARSKQPADLGGLVAALDGFAGQAWTASAIHLVRSYLGPNPRYETLESWPLGG